MIKSKSCVLLSISFLDLLTVRITLSWYLSKSLEKEMATYSSILAWKTPWMEEPGRLRSMGSQRVGHD